MNEKLKQAVRDKLLADLATYFELAEEHEDGSSLQDLNMEKRSDDFYRYMYIARGLEEAK